MEVKNDNELIAEFMGKPLSLERYDDSGRSDHKISYNGYYHEWNHLMPVVEKICPMGYNIKIKFKECEISKIFGVSATEYYDLQIEDTTIQAVYKAVVKFIKWLQLNPQRGKIGL